MVNLVNPAINYPQITISGCIGIFIGFTTLMLAHDQLTSGLPPWQGGAPPAPAVEQSLETAQSLGIYIRLEMIKTSNDDMLCGEYGCAHTHTHIGIDRYTHIHTYIYIYTYIYIIYMHR